MKRNKKILFVINKFKTGGAERLFVNDINALYELNYDVHVVTLLPESEKDSFCSELSIPGGNQYCLQAGGKITQIRDLYRYIKRNDIEVVYSTLDKANIYARVVGMFIPSLRVCVRESNVASIKNFKMKMLDMFLNIRSNIVVAVSKSVRDSLIVYQPWNAEKIFVLENALPIPPEDAVCIPRQNEEPILLSVGSLTSQKRHDVLLRMLSHLPNKNVRLVIVGGGSEEGALKKLARELAIEGRVDFMGVIPHGKVNEWYKKSSIFVLASQWEGDPNVVKEAMAHCLPVVTSDIKSMYGIFTPDERNFLVRVGDAEMFANKVRVLLENIHVRKQYAEHLYEKALRDYDMEKHIDKLIDLLSI
jgi:glycosyltransferase involved in cell wall biosynthesis